MCVCDINAEKRRSLSNPNDLSTLLKVNKFTSFRDKVWIKQTQTKQYLKISMSLPISQENVCDIGGGGITVLSEKYRRSKVSRSQLTNLQALFDFSILSDIV